jgi:CoA:oxalate CoA-transferase
MQSEGTGHAQNYPRPLDGVCVIDLGQIYNAPYATLLLALAGADVIKVEPLSGETSRRRREVNLSAGLSFYMLNSNKRSVTLNLKDPRGKSLLLEMVDRSSVLVENFRPGVMDRLGLGAEALLSRKPSLVYASGSGYGQQGTYVDLPAMDLTVQAMSGVISSTGFTDGPPVKSGPALSDFLGGIHLYGAIVTALYRREVTGRGSKLDVAMLDSVYPTLMSNIGPHIGTELGIASAPPPERTGNHQGGLSECPYNVYATKDGYVSIICLEEIHWTALLNTMERSDLIGDPRYATKSARVRAMQEVDDLVTDWSSTKPTDEVFTLVRQSGIPCAPVRSLREVVYDPHFRERGMIHDFEVPGVGVLPLIHTPLLFGGEDREPLKVAPELGEHNDDVYGQWLGHSAEELAKLRADDVI